MTDGLGSGEDSLAQTVAAAAAIRRLTGLLMVQEQDHPAVVEMLEQFPDWEARLAATAPSDLTPRIGRTRRAPVGSISTTPLTSVRTTRAFPNTASTVSTATLRPAR